MSAPQVPQGDTLLSELTDETLEPVPLVPFPPETLPLEPTFTPGVRSPTQTASNLRPIPIDPSKTFPSVTTEFSIPQDCSTKWLLISLSGTASITSGYVGTTDLVSGVNVDYWRVCNPLSTIPAYSPGICFRGHTLLHVVQTSTQLASLQKPQTEWQGLCCPSGMSPTSSQSWQCQGTFTTPFEVLAPVVITLGDPPTTYTAWDGIWRDTQTGTDEAGFTITTVRETQPRSIQTIPSGTRWAEAVTVLWQSSDLSKFPSSIVVSLARVMNITLPSDSSSTNPVPPAGSGGVSKAAIAGICIGTIIGAGILGGMIIFCLMRHRKKAKDLSLPEMSGQDSGFKNYFAGKWRAEADGSSNPVEIDSRQVVVIPGPPVELEGSHLQTTRHT